MAEDATANQTTDSTAEEATTAGNQTSDERVYKQADVDAITAKVRQGLEKKLAKATADLETARQAALSEDDKKLEEARKAGAAEKQAELDTIRRQSAIERALMAKGVDPGKLERAARLAMDSDIEDAAEAVEAFGKEWPEFFQSNRKQYGGGGGGTADDFDGDEYPPERVEKLIAAGKYEEHREKIDRWRAKKMGSNAGWLRPPGQ